MKGYVIGIDGGGSKTLAHLCDLTGKTLGEGLSGPSNPLDLSEQRLVANLREAISNACAMAQVEQSALLCVFAGIAGAASEVERELLAQCIRSTVSEATLVYVDHDLRIALTAGLHDQPGIVLIAGTGSACYGRNPSGDTHRTRDNDKGSGSWVGQQAIRQAQKEDADPQLKAVVSQQLGSDVLAFAADQLPRREFAALYPFVERLAMEGNETAINIVTEGIRSLIELIVETKGVLDLQAPEIVLAGGLMQSSPYKATLLKRLKRRLPQATIAESSATPVKGAVLEALAALGGNS